MKQYSSAAGALYRLALPARATPDEHPGHPPVPAMGENRPSDQVHHAHLKLHQRVPHWRRPYTPGNGHHFSAPLFFAHLSSQQQFRLTCGLCCTSISSHMTVPHIIIVVQ